MIQALSLAYVCATLALVPFFIFMSAITVAAFFGRRKPTASPSAPPARSRFLIVIPAHDEEGTIAATVRSCRNLDYNASLYEIHVIADNCTDATAASAAEAGALVVERTHATLRSKGHALEYFFTQNPEGLTTAGLDATVLIDADTVVDPNLLNVFDRALREGKDWIQGYYTVSNPDSSWRTRMMTIAFSLANGVWMLGLDRLGLGVGLKGNGMCFSVAGLRRVPWRAYGLVEDMEFALTLRAAGERVRFEPSARVYGEMVSRGGVGAASQRRRWEAGRQSLRAKFAGVIYRSKILGLYTKCCYLFDLFFPPLSTLALGLLMASSVHAVAMFWDHLAWTSRLLLPLHAAMLGSFAVYAISPILVMDLPASYLMSLLALPYYIVWKIAVALGRPPRSWVRTPRESRRGE